MKTLRHLSLLILFCCAFSSSHAQWVTIPDANFVSYLQRYSNCMNGNQLDTTCPDIINEYGIDCQRSYIQDLYGIQFFDNLQVLRCHTNNITAFPPLPRRLKDFDITGNKITSLAGLPDSLEHLYAGNNLITSIPALPASLLEVEVYSNQIATLPTLPPGLKVLYCSSNRLTNIPPLPSTLEQLDVRQNRLTSLPPLPTGLLGLDISANYSFNVLPALPPGLQGLSFGSNGVTSLPPLPLTIQTLNCSGNRLDSLPNLWPGLSYLYCGGNFYTSLPALPASLKYLDCVWSNLTSLPTLPDSLRQLICDKNPYLHCLPHLPPNLFSINFDSTTINCIPNYVNVKYSYPDLRNMLLCYPFNTNGCNTYWNIKGTVFSDVNGNCVQQASDSNLALIKVNLLKNGIVQQQTYTSNYGVYSFDTDTGSFTTTVDTTGIPFTIKCPVSQFDSATVTPLDSLKAGLNFAMQCKAGFDVGIQSIAVVTQFRPGAVVPVIFNAGDLARMYGSPCNTANVSGQLVITISGPATYTGPAPGARTPVVNGNTLTYTVNNWATVPAGAFNFRVSTAISAQAGQQVCFSASVTPAAGDNNAINNSVTQCFNVVNSYDPNDKQVSPADAINNTSQWLTYTIRFQNTGTAPAIHIYVIDTLDAALDINSFQLLAYSHQAVVNIYSDQRYARFTFTNINLADSLHNEPQSHGFIQYRIKTLPGLNCGTQMGNAAHIYFDYNPPVATNAAINTVYGSLTKALQANICHGETFTFNGQILSSPGNYSDTIQASVACDTVINLQLAVVSAFEEYQNATVCNGETYTWRNRSLSSTGTYADTLQTATACDSIITLQLQVLPAITQSQSGTTCAGEPFNFNGRTLTIAGVYSDTLQASTTCDSIVTLQLQVLPAYSQTESATVCYGETYNWHNRSLTAGGNYADTLQASSTCDSIIILQLQVLPAIIQNQSGSTCVGQPFNFNGRVLTAAGVYTDTLQASSSCDSIITLQLQVLPAIIQNQSSTTCAGESFNFNGRALTAAGVYTDTLQASTSCDSIVTLQLQVLPSYSQSESATVCYSETYNWHNRSLTAAGVYTDTLQASTSCDSIVTLQLQVLPSYSQTESATVCNGETFNWRNLALTTAGNYADTLQASSSCDSIITLQLQVLQGAEITESAAICDGETYNWRNRSLTARDTYTDTLQTTAGCDSVLILNLEVYTGYSAVVDTAILSGTSLVLPSGTTVTAPGNYTDTLQSIFGCDSIIITRLSVISGIENLANTATMQLYPNPAQDLVMINLSDNLTGGTLTLSDVTGRGLATIQLTASHNQLNTASLSSGVYLVTAEKGGVRVVQRLVVSH